MAKQKMVSLFPEPSPEELAREPIWTPFYDNGRSNCGHAHDGQYPDGYDGGSEGVVDVYVDRMVYPHKEGQMEAQMRERYHEEGKKIEAQKEKECYESRSFDIDIKNKTGR